MINHINLQFFVYIIDGDNSESITNIIYKLTQNILCMFYGRSAYRKRGANIGSHRKTYKKADARIKNQRHWTHTYNFGSQPLYVFWIFSVK